jgi:hypothetical protein
MKEEDEEEKQGWQGKTGKRGSLLADQTAQVGSSAT